MFVNNAMDQIGALHNETTCESLLADLFSFAVFEYEFKIASLQACCIFSIS